MAAVAMTPMVTRSLDPMMLAETLTSALPPLGALAWQTDLLRGLSALERGEVVLLAFGTALLLAGVVIITARREWRRSVALPPPPEHALNPADLFLGLLAGLVLPSFFSALVRTITTVLGDGAVAATMPATSAPASVALPNLGANIGLAVGQVGTIVVLVKIGLMRMRGGLAGWGLSLTGFARRLAMAVLIFVAIWPICALVLALTREFLEVCGIGLPAEHAALLGLKTSLADFWTKAVLAVNAVVLAPMAEELFYRGLLQPALARWTGSPWAGVAAASLVFGVMHQPMFDTVPAMVVFGAILAMAYARSGSLTLVVLIHAVFNAKNVVQALLM